MAADEGQGKAGRKAAWQPMGASGQDCMVADGSAQSASNKEDTPKARSRIEGTTPPTRTHNTSCKRPGTACHRYRACKIKQLT